MNLVFISLPVCSACLVVMEHDPFCFFFLSCIYIYIYVPSVLMLLACLLASFPAEL